jgi:hypothetical protein
MAGMETSLDIQKYCDHDEAVVSRIDINTAL